MYVSGKVTFCSDVDGYHYGYRLAICRVVVSCLRFQFLTPGVGWKFLKDTADIMESKGLLLLQAGHWLVTLSSCFQQIGWTQF